MKRLAALFFCLPVVAAPIFFNEYSQFAGSFDIGVEALYWKPMARNFPYATLTAYDNGLPFSISAEHVKPSYNWGARAFVGYEDRCNSFFVTLDWTYFRSTALSLATASDVSSLTAPYLVGLFAPEPPVLAGSPEEVPFVFYLNNARGRLQFCYNTVSCRAGYYFQQGCWGEMYAYAGGRYIQLKQKRKLQSDVFWHDFTIQPTELLGPQVQHDHAQLNGGGVEFGIGGEYRLLCGVNLVGRVGIVGAIGYQTLKGRFAFGGNEVFEIPYFETPLAARSMTRVFPGCELRLGLKYSHCFRDLGCVPNLELVGEIGYEFNYYYNALCDIDLNAVDIEPAPGGPFTTTSSPMPTRSSSLGFGGPYVGLTLCF